MKTERLNDRWQDGDIVYNLFLTIPNAWTAELVGHAGFDALTIDMQHGLTDISTAVSMLQAIQGTPAAAMVRLRWNEPSHIMQVLDAGVRGVICPMINTPADVEDFLSACHYPPVGIRSFGPLRAGLYHRGDYRTTAHEELLTFAMIETAAAVDNLEEIAAVPGLTGLFVGPYDLSISLGLQKTADVHDQSLLSVLDRVLHICREHELISGVHTANTEHAAFLARRGYRLISCGDDSGLLLQSAKAKLSQLGLDLNRER